MNFFFFWESACQESTLASAAGQERSDPGRVNRLRLRLLSFMMKMGGRGAFVYRLSLRAYTWGGPEPGAGDGAENGAGATRFCSNIKKTCE